MAQATTEKGLHVLTLLIHAAAAAAAPFMVPTS
jgi:hypothetical protein